MITCILSWHHMATSPHVSVPPSHPHLPIPPGAEIPALSRGGHIVDRSVVHFTWWVVTRQGASLIYKDAVTFINACLIKSLFHFNLILPLANFGTLWELRCVDSGKSRPQTLVVVLSGSLKWTPGLFCRTMHHFSCTTGVWQSPFSMQHTKQSKLSDFSPLWLHAVAHLARHACKLALKDLIFCCPAFPGATLPFSLSLRIPKKGGKRFGMRPIYISRSSVAPSAK